MNLRTYFPKTFRKLADKVENQMAEGFRHDPNDCVVVGVAGQPLAWLTYIEAIKYIKEWGFFELSEEISRRLPYGEMWCLLVLADRKGCAAVIPVLSVRSDIQGQA